MMCICCTAKLWDVYLATEGCRHLLIVGIEGYRPRDRVRLVVGFHTEFDSRTLSMSRQRRKLFCSLKEPPYRPWTPQANRRRRRIMNKKIRVVEEAGDGKMVLLIATLTGGRIVLGVLPSDTIKEVKQQIQDKVFIPPESQLLIFAGIRLYDGLTLNDYRIPRETTIHLVAYPRD